LNYTDLHKRYGNLYIPSDFVRVDLSWKNSFNLESPIAFSSNSIDFHVLQKDVDYPFAETNPLPEELPADADSRYIVKVLLPAHPGAIDIRKKVTGLLADGSIDESLDVQNVFKVLHFITGNRGKGEVMGIGSLFPCQRFSKTFVFRRCLFSFIGWRESIGSADTNQDCCAHNSCNEWRGSFKLSHMVC
jgi:hypothetical protein